MRSDFQQIHWFKTIVPNDFNEVSIQSEDFYFLSLVENQCLQFHWEN